MGGAIKKKRLNLQNAPVVQRTIDSVKLEVLLLGDPHCGKTALAHRFIEGSFSEGKQFYLNETNNTKEIEIYHSGCGEKRKAKLRLTEESLHNSILRNSFRDKQIIVILFSVYSRKSFDHISSWYEEHQATTNCDSLNNKDHFSVLVGTKCDYDTFSMAVQIFWVLKHFHLVPFINKTPKKAKKKQILIHNTLPSDIVNVIVRAFCQLVNFTFSDGFRTRLVQFHEANSLAEQLGIPYLETSAKDRRNVNELFEMAAIGFLDSVFEDDPLVQY